ncbi:MAG: hypothetical protein JWN04_6076 [Myxococcaceae bacterium]|nr:hypothetical protein [Myxococcaceae bacterium]
MPALLGIGPFASRAQAHASPHGIQLLWTSSDASALPIILSNRGLVMPNLSDQDGPGSLYSLRCNEGYHLSTSEVPVLFADDQGALVLASPESVSASADRGCSWVDGTGLPDISLGGFTQNQSAPNKLIITTQIYTMASQLFSSEDYGRTWSVLGSNAMYTVYSQLLSSADGVRMFAAGKRYDLASKNLLPIWASSVDSGKTWVDQDLSNARFPLGLHPTDAMVLFAREPVPNMSLDPQDNLLRSDDGGKTFTTVSTLDPISAFASTPDGSVIWVGTQAGGLFVSRDGGKTFARQDADEVAGITCLAYHDDKLWVCANFAPNTNGVWYSSDKGESYTQLLDFTNIATNVSCPAATAPVCAQPWLDWQYELRYNFTVDAGVPDGGLDTRDAGAPVLSTPADAAVVSNDDAAPSPADAGATQPPASKHDGGCSITTHSGASTQLSSWLLTGLALLLSRRKKHA